MLAPRRRRFSRSRCPCGIAIPKVEPKSRIISEHATNFPEHINELRNELIGRTLETNLPVNAVVSQPPIRRARNAAVDRPFGEAPELLNGVTL